MDFKKRLFSLFFSFSLFLGLVFLSQNHRLYAATEPADPEQVPVKVLLVIYDPVLEAYGGVKLHQYYAPQGWNDPVTLANQLVTDLNTQSHGKVSYQIVQTIDRDEWPIFQDGTRYDDPSYIADFNVWDDHASTWGNYNAIINDNGIVAKINNGEIDEVWMYGAPGFGWWEATTAGNGAYSTNGGPVTGVNTRVFSILGLSFQRGNTEALHSFSHGTEGVMRKMYDYWSFGYGAPPAQAPAFYHSWDQFTVKNYDPGDLIGCGFVHGNMNIPSYDPNQIWTSTNTVPSTCDDWSNYPYLTGTTVDTNCTAWGCTYYGGLKWWLSHMPYFTGSYDGYLSNWWRYFTNLDLYKNIRQLNPLRITTDFAENNAASWSCTPSSGRTCSFSNDTTNKLFGVSSVKLTTNDLNNIVSTYPSAKNANWNLTTTGIFSFWVYPTNPNSPNYFQGSVVVKLLNSLGNGYAYTADSGLLDGTLNSWRKFDIPLGGDTTWVRTSIGTPNLADVDYVEIHADTWGDSFTLTFDGLGFVTDYAETATNWACPGSTCVATQSAALSKEGINAMKLSTSSTGDATIVYPSTLTANWVLTNKNIVFWAYSNNPNSGKFETSSPKIDLLTTNSANYYRYTPTTNLLNSAINRWQRYEIPVNGNSLWTRTTVGTPSLANVDQIVIHSDTTGTSPYYVVYDGLRFESLDVTNPTVSITSPATGTTVTGIVPIKITAADNIALKRVDLLVDGVFVQTDAVAPYIISWDSSTVASGNHTLVAKAYDMAGNLATSTGITLNTQPDLIFSDGFESGNTSAWSSETDTENDLTVSNINLIHGSWSLSALIDNTTAMYLTNTSPISESRYRARFYLLGGFRSNNTSEFTLLLGRTTTSTFGVQLRYDSTDAENYIRTQIYNDAGAVTSGTWIRLTSISHSIEIDWKASSAPGANDGYISLWIDGNAKGTQSDIDNDTKKVEEVRFGIVSSPGTGADGTIIFDTFESLRSSYMGPVDIIFSDGFESGNASAWSSETDSENDLVATYPSALGGSWGLSALVDNTTSMFVTDTSPASEPQYLVEFDFDPNSIAMANGDTFTILSGKSPTGSTVFQIQLSYSSTTGYNLRTQIYSDSGVETSGVWVPITDAPHFIFVHWEAATPPYVNGEVYLSVDGGIVSSQVGEIDNDALRVENVNFGIVNGVDSGTFGTMYFDKFEARRDVYTVI